MQMKNKRVKKAVIPAAGLGTRFLPATKALPKDCLLYTSQGICKQKCVLSRAGKEWLRNNGKY